MHFLQVWISPARLGLEPGYEQKHFPDGEKRGQLRLIAARDGEGGAVTIHADARVYAALLEPGQRVSHALGEDRHAWVQVTRGVVTLDSQPLVHGDGAAVSGEPGFTIASAEGAEVLLFDLA